MDCILPHLVCLILILDTWNNRYNLSKFNVLFRLTFFVVLHLYHLHYFTGVSWLYVALPSNEIHKCQSSILENLQNITIFAGIFHKNGSSFRILNARLNYPGSLPRPIRCFFRGPPRSSKNIRQKTIRKYAYLFYIVGS